VPTIKLATRNAYLCSATVAVSKRAISPAVLVSSCKCLSRLLKISVSSDRCFPFSLACGVLAGFGG
jgi:hypothetical protein